MNNTGDLVIIVKTCAEQSIERQITSIWIYTRLALFISNYIFLHDWIKNRCNQEKCISRE